jgi:hypothetical protein
MNLLKVIRLKGKTNAEDIIPIKDLASIISYLDKNMAIQIKNLKVSISRKINRDVRRIDN